MKFSEAMDEFLIAGRQGGWRMGTVDSYRWHLRRFNRWLVEHESEYVEDLSTSLVRRWGAQIHDGWQPSTTRGAIAAARSFLKWLYAEKLIEHDLAASLKMPKVPERAQRTISTAEVGKLFTACSAPLREEDADDQDLALAVRNVALVAVLYDSLLRAAELCALKLNDIDLKSGTLRVRSGKGGKGRTAPIGPDAVLALKVWLPMRQAAHGVDNVFVSLGGITRGQPLTVSGLRLILRKLGERCDLHGVCPHAFRRGGAVAATLAGAPSRLVQVWGGWSNIQMVELYTRTLQNDPEALKEFKRFSPSLRYSRDAAGCRRRPTASRRPGRGCGWARGRKNGRRFAGGVGRTTSLSDPTGEVNKKDGPLIL